MENAEAIIADGSSDPGTLKRKRTGGGQRKIPMELIQNKDARQVCFSKRRIGLFKKAYELLVLCGAHGEVVAFSPAGNPYTFIHPSDSSSASNKYLHLSSSSRADLNRQVSELAAKVETARRKEEAIEATVKGIGEDIWSADVSRLDLAQLEALKTRLMEVKGAVGL